MGQIFANFELPGTLLSSGSVLTLASARVTIGGQQYTIASLTCNTATVGVGGAEAALVASTLYYLCAVIVGSTPQLIATTRPTGPLGYPYFKIVGFFDTSFSAAIQTVGLKTIGEVGEWKTAHMTEAQFVAKYGPGWILSDTRVITNSTFALLSGLTNAPEGRGVVLRGKSGTSGQNPDGDLALGTFQGDNFAAHVHVSNSNNATIAGGSTGWTGSSYQQFGTFPSGAAGGNETRMKNTTANHFIKIN